MLSGPFLSLRQIAIRGTEDFTSPELLTGMQLYEDCEDDEVLEGEMRDVVAADAWSVGAIIYNAATGDYLVPDGPECVEVGGDSDDSDEDDNLRPAFLMERHEKWKVFLAFCTPCVGDAPSCVRMCRRAS